MGDLLFDSISGGKWCPLGHTSPTMKHTPATESKVHNGEGPYHHPDLRFSRSLHLGEARLGHESKVHNSEGPYSHSDFRFSSFFWGPLPPENRTFPSPKFIHKDLCDLLMSRNINPVNLPEIMVRLQTNCNRNGFSFLSTLIHSEITYQNSLEINFVESSENQIFLTI